MEGKPLTETYPNGMERKYTYDATGSATKLEYVKTTHCTEKCTWSKETVTPSVHGQAMMLESGLSTKQYTYDAAGRLTQVQNTPAGEGCTTRIYNYDADTNRSSLTTRAPGAGGACATEGGTASSHTFDAADRLTDAGATYDAFGNITSLPAGDAGGTALTSGYYSDNQIQGHTQNGQTLTYKLDPAGRTRETLATGTLTSTIVNHYASPGSAPAWTVNSSAEWTRNIPGIDGQLAAIQNNGAAPVLQLTNLHGDIIATASQSETATGLASSTDSSEYGVPTTSTPAKYSWLGALEAPTELPSGVAELGVRSYVPQIGQFLQPDPVSGGSANTYGYTFGDPVNSSDPSGASSIEELVAGHAAALAAAARAKEAAETAARQAAEEASARATAEHAAAEARRLAGFAAGSQYLEEEEEEYEEEEGEEEDAADHEGNGAEREQAQPQPGLFYQPLLPETMGGQSAESNSSGVVQVCAQVQRPEACAMGVSLFSKAKRFVKKLYRGAKWVWKEYPGSALKVWEFTGIRVHWPTRETLVCATAAATLAVVAPEVEGGVVTAAKLGMGFDLACGALDLKTIGEPKYPLGPG